MDNMIDDTMIDNSSMIGFTNSDIMEYKEINQCNLCYNFIYYWSYNPLEIF